MFSSDSPPLQPWRSDNHADSTFPQHRRWINWAQASSAFFGAPNILNRQSSFFDCPASVLDTDGTLRATPISVTASFTGQGGAGLAPRILDVFSQLDGQLVIADVLKMARRISKDSEAGAHLSVTFNWSSDESLAVATKVSSTPAVGLPVVHYSMSNNNRRIWQGLQILVRTRCPYADCGNCEHEQMVLVVVEMDVTHPIANDTVIKLIQQQSQCTIHGLLKLTDQLALPEETAASKFVDEIASDVHKHLHQLEGIRSVAVTCESIESCHNYRGIGQVADLDWGKLP